MTGEVFYTENEISDIFSDMHFIYVVHGIKAKGLAESEKTLPLDRENIDWVCKAIKNASAEPILFENNRPQNIHVFANRFKEFTERLDLIEITKQQTTASDYKFDNDITRLNMWKNREKFAICAEPTYEGLELSIRHYKNRFQLVSEIVEPVSFIESFDFIKRSDKKFVIEGTINCSPYFNVIIGNSGSGKTLLLNELYRSVKTPPQNLDAVLIKDSGKRTNNGAISIYEGYIGKGKTLLRSKIYGGKPIVVEIDKIYKTLLSAEDPTEIASLFNVSLPTDVNSVLLKYQEKLNNYESLTNNIDINRSNGEKSLDAILSNHLFILNNSVEKSSFLLKRMVFDDTILKKNNGKISKINHLKQEKYVVDNWINEVKEALPNAKKELMNAFLLQYNEILAELDAQANLIELELKKNKVDYSLINHYNNAIEEVSKIVSNKQAEVEKADATIVEQSNTLKECVKNCILFELKCESMDLSYPFSEIKEKAESSQSNNQARIVVDYLGDDIRFSEEKLSNSRLFDTEGKQTKIKKAIGKTAFNLSKSADVKNLTMKLHKNGLSLMNMLVIEIPYITQIKDDGIWKNATDINPGNLAKNYMSYYFQSIIDTARPNVVFIDQPENDVDKTFISDVLASFISDHKKSVQFFITSHEPILGVNADSNMIIEAYRNSGGAISYRAKSFEHVSNNDSDESGVMVASRILDGGKNNVIKRNQIYGGSIDD